MHLERLSAPPLCFGSRELGVIFFNCCFLMFVQQSLFCPINSLHSIKKEGPETAIGKAASMCACVYVCVFVGGRGTP